MKKAQTEMVGLLVIVILLIFIAVIYIRLTSIPGERDVIRQNVMVTNLLNSIMKYSCSNGQIEDLVSSRNAECGITPLEGVISRIITLSLGHEMYRFTVDKRDDAKLEITGLEFDNCGDKFVDTYFKPRFTAVLEICSRSL